MLIYSMGVSVDGFIADRGGVRVDGHHAEASLAAEIAAALDARAESG